MWEKGKILSNKYFKIFQILYKNNMIKILQKNLEYMNFYFQERETILRVTLL